MVAMTDILIMIEDIMCSVDYCYCIDEAIGLDCSYGYCIMFMVVVD